jgi:hypothetical protein
MIFLQRKMEFRKRILKKIKIRSKINRVIRREEKERVLRKTISTKQEGITDKRNGLKMFRKMMSFQVVKIIVINNNSLRGRYIIG